MIAVSNQRKICLWPALPSTVTLCKALRILAGSEIVLRLLHEEQFHAALLSAVEAGREKSEHSLPLDYRYPWLTKVICEANAFIPDLVASNPLIRVTLAPKYSLSIAEQMLPL